VEGNLEEIGEWSALILTQNALSRGTKVRIWGKSHKIKGYVRSCKYDRMLGFFVDIGLDPGSRWSEKWFRPEHLFSLCPSMRYFTEAVPKVPEKFLLPKTAHVWGDPYRNLRIPDDRPKPDGQLWPQANSEIVEIFEVDRWRVLRLFQRGNSRFNEASIGNLEQQGDAGATLRQYHSRRPQRRERYGRLKPGLTIALAQARLNAFSAQAKCHEKPNIYRRGRRPDHR
jgi:hypothetical protein